MIKLLLSDTSAYPWCQGSGIAFRGSFIANRVLYREQAAIDFLAGRFKEKSLSDTLLELNGVFSIVIDNLEGVYLVADRVRSLPIFYAFENDTFFISDQAQNIYDALNNATFDAVSIEDFKKNGLYVTGHDTLYCQIKQVQAGEWVFYNHNTNQLLRRDYFLHGEGEIKHRNPQGLHEHFKPIFQEACDNLKTALDGRTALVPLSGGTDSRELLLMLHTIGYKDVICFSYGKKGNLDCVCAKKIADYFGYPWLEINYNRRLWRELKRYQEGEFLNKYLFFSGNYSSLPHIQDLLAVKTLEEKNLIPANSVFLPGHTGAVVGGVLNPAFLQDKVLSYSEIMKIIKGGYYHCITDKHLSPKLHSKLNSFFSPDKCNTNEESEAQYHCFAMKERQAKFIINSVRVYEYFGYEWLLPLCDKVFLDFMKSIPLSLKHNKKFIRDFMGLKEIQSTSDQTIYKTITNQVRQIPPLRILARKISKVTKYFFSALQIEGTFGLLPYMREAIKGDEFFTVNTVLNKYYLSLLKEKKNDSE